jgi:DNA-binding transcriptional LysR family regulator
MKSGLGISVAPLHTVQNEIKEKSLHALDTKDFPPLINRLYLSYREASLNQVHEKFKDWLLKTAKA